MAKKGNKALRIKNVVQGHSDRGLQIRDLIPRLFESKVQGTKKAGGLRKSTSVLLTGFKTAVLASKICSWHGPRPPCKWSLIITSYKSLIITTLQMEA